MEDPGTNSLSRSGKNSFKAVFVGTDTDVLVNCSGRVVRALDDKGKKSVAAVIGTPDISRGQLGF